MKYFLDTNIILILFQGRNNELRSNVKEILNDSRNRFYASSISLNEITQLYRKKKIFKLDYDQYNTASYFLKSILKVLFVVEFLPFCEKHALKVSDLDFVGKHNDPNDLAIIAHSMVEKAFVISTDVFFSYYEEQGAKVIYNPR